MADQKWHRGAGVAVTSDMTTAEMLEKANLNWRVETSPFRYGEDFGIEEDKCSIAYHGESGDSFGIVGPRRKIFQNAQIVQSLRDFCEMSGDGLQINRLGQLNGGKNIFAVATLKHVIDVKSVGDIIETRLLLKESHENGKGLQIMTHMNRLVCTNGMTQLVKVKGKTLGHVKEFNTASVRAYLSEAYEGVAQYGETMEALAQIEVKGSEAKMHYIKALGNPSLAWEDQPVPVHTCYKLFKSTGMGSEMLSAYNTLFGVKEAFSEYVNWHQKGSVGERAFVSVCGGPRGQANSNFLKQLVSVHL